MALTGKQAAFIDEYMIDRNATRAAQRAGYKGDANTLGVTGYDLLRNPKIDEVIKQRFAENAMSADEVASLLAEVARGSMEDFVTFRSGVKLPLLDLERAHAAGKFGLVKKLKYTADGAVEFELYDKLSAIAQIAKALGLDRVTVTGADGGPVRTKGEQTIEHKFDSDTAATIFDLLATVGAIKTVANDAKDDEIHPT